MPDAAKPVVMTARPDLAPARGYALRRHIALLAVACVLPVLAFCGIMLLRLAQQERAIEQGQIFGTARAISSAIDLQLKTVISALAAFSTSRDLATLGSGDLARFYEQCEHVAAQHGGWMVISDADGRQLLNTLAPPGAKLPPIANIDLAQAALRSGQPQVSNLFDGAVTNRRMVAVFYPVVSRNLVLILARPAEAVSEIFAEQRVDEDWTIAIVDRNGVLLGRNRKLDAFIGRLATADLRAKMRETSEGNFVFSTSEDTRVETAFTRSALSGWTVAVGIPIESVEAPLWRSLEILLGGGLLMLVLGIAVASFIGGRIGRAMSGVARSALALGRGEALQPVSTPVRELADIITAQHAAAGLLAARARERDAAEAALRESQAQLARAQRIASVGSLERDIRTGRATVSAEAYRIAGISPAGADLTSASVMALIHPADRAAIGEAVARSLAGEHGVAVDARLIRPDGETRRLHIVYEPTLTAPGAVTGFMASFQDVTEFFRLEEQRRELESQLNRAQRVEAVGTLAGGLAHDLNNALVPIIALTRLVQKELPQGSRGAQNLDLILEAGQRARSLVYQLLTFSRKEEGEKAPVDLPEMLHQTLDMLRATIPATIHLERRVAAVPTVLADRGQLQQVLVNLVTNAAQAIGPSLGRIVVEVADGARPQRAGGDPTRRWVRLAVSDTGPGMDEATQRRIFEPFFTTKPVGEGTGLGLSVVHGIIDGHGGHITVESAPGQGARFDILLPALAAVAEPAIPARAAG